MKPSKMVAALASLIGVLAFVAAMLGVFWQGSAGRFDFKTLRGETVAIQGGGLYKYDSVSGASQSIAQDVVTLCIGIPILVIAIILYLKGSLRGKLLLTGTLAYFSYTYVVMTFQSAYNPLFLIYTALYSLSLVTLILSLRSIELAKLPASFSDKLPRKSISIYLFATGGFLFLAWLGRIVPALLDGSVPYGLESYSTLVIQAADLGIIVPLSLLAGVLLLKQNAWGYLLASIALIQGFTLSTAVSAMVVGQLMASVSVSPVEIIIFPTLTLIGIGLFFVMLKNVKSSPAVQTRPKPGKQPTTPKALLH
jgi:hypothetical protein